MRFLNLPLHAKVYDLFASRQCLFTPFTDFCELLMRGTSQLSRAQRELIGAFVSSLNNCAYCHDVHNAAVKAYGLDDTLTDQLRNDLQAARTDDNFKCLLVLARKVTETAGHLSDADLAHCREAGWGEEAIQDALFVACLFNFMNRLVSACDIRADQNYIATAGVRIRDVGYNASFQETVARNCTKD